MKKFLFTVITALFGIGNAVADEFVVSDITIPQGGSATIEIGLNNPDTESRGFQFIMSFDKAVTASHPVRGARINMVEQNEYLYSLASHSTTEGFQVLAYTTSTVSITGTTGTVASITLTADGSLDVGTTVTGTLSACTISNTGGITTPLNDVTFTVNVVEQHTIVLDETSTTAPEASDGEVTVKVKRTIKANEWSTLVLPFDMTEEQVKEAFGDDVQLAEFTNYEADYDDNDNLTGLTVNFDATDLAEGFYGNYPYLVKTSKDITEFVVTATIDPDESDAVAEYDNGKTGPKRKVLGSFIGTYHAGDAVPANGLFLNGNKFYYSTGKTKIKAFRAYFMFNDVLSSMEAEANMRFIVDEQPTTIEGIGTSNVQKGTVYNMNGQLVGNDLDLNSQPKGIYFVDGKKVVNY